VEVLTTEYEGLSLMTDVECEVVSFPDNAVALGSNWLFAWREVWRSQMGSSSFPECHAPSPAGWCSRDLIPSNFLRIDVDPPCCTVPAVASTTCFDSGSEPSEFGECCVNKPLHL